ncbi:MAG: SRPBCC family protein [Chloroflexi bacterium]|nr:SRPBCC family protein [Chloroflexota bacterium]
MRHMEIVARVPGRTPDEVYPVLCDYRRWPELSDAVRSVKVLEEEDRRSVTEWEVNFNRGIMRWTEEDRFDPNAKTIHFVQTAGEPDHFAGDWVVTGLDGDSVVRFTADLDLGIPGLSDMLEPIAEQALRSNVRSILSGLFKIPIELEPVASA